MIGEDFLQKSLPILDKRFASYRKILFGGAPPVAPTTLPNSLRPTPAEAFSGQTVPGLAVRHARESYAEKLNSRPHKQPPVLNTNCNTTPLSPPSEP